MKKKEASESHSTHSPECRKPRLVSEKAVDAKRGNAAVSFVVAHVRTAQEQQRSRLEPDDK